MQLAETAHDGLVGRGVVLDAKAGVLGLELVHGVRELLLVAVLGRSDGKAEQGDRTLDGAQVVMVLVMGVMEHRIEMDVIDTSHCQDVAGQALVHLDLLVPMQTEQVVDLECFAGIADEQLGVRRDSSLMDTEDTELAAKRVVDHLEDVGQDMPVRVWCDADGLDRSAFALQIEGWITLGRARHKPHQYLQKLWNTGARLGGDETDRDQVGLAKGLLEGVVQLLRGQILALLQVKLHELFVDLHHLVDDLAVGLRYGGKVRLFPSWLKEAIDHALAAVRRQVDRQAPGAEGLLDPGSQLFELHGLGIDLVDQDHAAQLTAVRCAPHTLRNGLDPGLGVDHYGGGLHGGQNREGAADEIG